MKQVTIRRCPVCDNIRALSDSVAAALKGDNGLNVRVVDGAKGEFTVQVNGRQVAGPSGETLPTTEEVVGAVRSEAGSLT